jgi:acyl carrier protein
MNAPVVLEQLTPLFQDLFDDPSLTLRDDMTADDVAGWDSLTHINLIVAVEKRFRIRLSTGEVQSLKNVGALVLLIARKTN